MTEQVIALTIDLTVLMLPSVRFHLPILFIQTMNEITMCIVKEVTYTGYRAF